MRKNCEGCQYDFQEALRGQELGLHFATSLEDEYDGRKHFILNMVNDKGEVEWW